jgi:hypothetical protein
MLTSVLLVDLSLATNIKDEVMVDWNADNAGLLLQISSLRHICQPC